MEDVRSCMKGGEVSTTSVCECVRHPLRSELSDIHRIEGIQSFIEHFGREQVLVIPSERLWKSPVPELHALEKFLGLAHIDSAHWISITRKKYIPEMDAQSRELKLIALSAQEPLASDAGVLPEGIDILLQEIFQEANCKLQKILGVEWTEHGYKCSRTIGDVRSANAVQDSLEVLPGTMEL
eukprot:gnl/MRDRNA2_/MRDRNA2_63831_c0_seq2.p1 gnl/MRDRNA2_/MRDRNA2_63831_c0~~gnl/MRDRNA2_/MRDRNA2_63831_c0_seq2.p1  ORF type:complete len:182 (+),score=24.61 gnl/MRDRNA2_/MRDRNA2_63831_c0_seq2:97-642(+)